MIIQSSNLWILLKLKSSRLSVCLSVCLSACIFLCIYIPDDNHSYFKPISFALTILIICLEKTVFSNVKNYFLLSISFFLVFFIFFFYFFLFFLFFLFSLKIDENLVLDTVKEAHENQKTFRFQSYSTSVSDEG